jgi:hypothetical protein
MNSYRYETHLHTKEASACSVSSAVELVHAYHQAGYAASSLPIISITATPLSTVAFLEGVGAEVLSVFETAEQEGKKLGFISLFGWRSISGDEYLIYGLDKGVVACYPR